MEIYDYHSAGGKNIILSYVEKLPKTEQLEIYDVRTEIRRNGLDAFEKLNTRQLRGKLWEIKAYYVRHYEPGRCSLSAHLQEAEGQS